MIVFGILFVLSFITIIFYIKSGSKEKFKPGYMEKDGEKYYYGDQHLNCDKCGHAKHLTMLKIDKEGYIDRCDVCHICGKETVQRSLRFNRNIYPDWPL